VTAEDGQGSSHDIRQGVQGHATDDKTREGTSFSTSGVPMGVEVQNPPEIPKALQNRFKLNPMEKTVKNC